jgi:hypothetical protein
MAGGDAGEICARYYLQGVLLLFSVWRPSCSTYMRRSCENVLLQGAET